MILLVEDSEDDVFLFERALRKAQLSLPLHNAADGQAAIDYLQGVGRYSDRNAFPLPSVVMLDLKLPYVHGFEVLRWIKGQSQLNKIPVVMLTSSLEEKDRARALQLGADGYLIKPPTPEVLARILSKDGVKGFPQNN